MRHRTTTPLVVWCCITVFVAGCEGVHLHDQAEADLAKQAQDQFKAADLTTLVDGERKSIDALLDRQLEVVRRDQKAQRDAALVEFIGGTDAEHSWKKFIEEVNGRLRWLAGSDTDRLYKAFTDQERQVAFLKTEKSLYQAMRQDGDPDFVWPLPAGVKEDGSTISAIAQGPFVECVGLAKKIDADQNIIDSTRPGRLGELTTQIKAAEAAVANVNATVDSAEKQFKASSGAYEAALATSKDPLQIAKLAAQVKNDLQSFDHISVPAADERTLDSIGLSGFKALGELAALDKKLKGISALLDRAADSAKTGTPSTQPSDLKKGEFYLTLAADIPAVANALAKAQSAGDVSALLIETQRLKIRQDDAKRKLASAQDRLDLLRQQRTATVLELRYVEKAWDALRDCTTYRARLDGQNQEATEPSTTAFQNSLAPRFRRPCTRGQGGIAEIASGVSRRRAAGLWKLLDDGAQRRRGNRLPPHSRPVRGSAGPVAGGAGRVE